MLIFEGPDGKSIIGNRCLLVTIDESGDEFATTDPQMPVFGLGACAVMASDYHEQIENPWFEMKDEFFGGRDVSLHATDLQNPTKDQINALNRFFNSQSFARLGVFITKDSLLDAPLARYQTVSSVLARQIARVASVLPCDAISLLVESSEKYDNKFYEVFAHIQFHLKSHNSDDEIPSELYKAHKSPLISSLEVADFIAHTAGTATRASLRGITPVKRPDFAHVFGKSESPMSQYIKIDQTV